MKEQLFFELLRNALGTQSGLSCVPSKDEWIGLLEEARRQTIAGVMARGLDVLSEDYLPEEELAIQWIGCLQRIENKYEVHCERAEELTVLFREKGLDSCVLKGISVARYYPNPSSRQCGDIDLWVKGKRSNVVSWLRSCFPIGHYVWHNISVDFFRDVPVEVHFHPAWLYNPLHNWRLQRFFEDRKAEVMALKMTDLNVFCPPVEFDAVFSLVHTFRHLIAEGVGLRHVVDYYYILNALWANGPGSVSRTRLLINHLGLGKIAGAMMWVLSSVCGLSKDKLIWAPNENEGRFFLSQLLAAGNFGHHWKGDPLPINSRNRYRVMLRHYPSEVIWIIPWKIWHFLWRLTHRIS